jgi:hypothetical protein
MKTLIAALALFSLAAGPAFAAGAYVPRSAHVPQFGYYGMPTAPGEVNIPNPSGSIPGA